MRVTTKNVRWLSFDPMHKWPVNPSMLTAAKTALQFQQNLRIEDIFVKGFEGEMLSGTLPTILLQINCKVVLHSKVMVRSNDDPDNNIVLVLTLPMLRLYFHPKGYDAKIL